MTDTPPPYGSQEPQQQPPPPYGATPQPSGQYGGYGSPSYGVGYVTDHPQATTVLILGILGLVLCGLAAPFAWVMGNRVVREIDASGGRLGGRSNANAGRILGIIGTCLVAVSLVFVVVVVVIAVVGVSSNST